jgi:beta-lactamase class A
VPIGAHLERQISSIEPGAVGDIRPLELDDVSVDLADRDVRKGVSRGPPDVRAEPPQTAIACLSQVVDPVVVRDGYGGPIWATAGTIELARLVLLDSGTGEVISIRGDERFPSASMIKIPILYEVMIRVEEGNLSLDDPLSMLEGDKAPGAGILQHLSAPFPLSVRDAGTLMIALSDNTATNLLLEKLGPRSVGERMSALWLQDSRVFRKVFGDPADSFDPPGSERWGLGVTSPMDLAKLLAWVDRGEAVSSGASREMLRMLDAQQHQVGLPRYLPDGVRVAHKTGTISAARHDCGIIYGPAREYVLCIMTRENEDTSGRGNNEAEVLQAELSRAIFDALNPDDPD